MTISTSKSKNSTTYYVKQTLYNNGKRTSKVIERLGSYLELEKRFGKEDTIPNAKKYAEELTRQEKEHRRNIMVAYSPVDLIEKGERRLFSAGYLFLQKIYHELRIDKICRRIEEKYKFDFDLRAKKNDCLHDDVADFLFHHQSDVSRLADKLLINEFALARFTDPTYPM